jgi:REP-associated tyrosine transposase
MGLYKNKYRVESARLKNWDYSIPWWYYVTICTKGMKHWFGKIDNGKMILNSIGKIIDEEWKRTEKVRSNVELDYYVIMPNHFHGIIIINNTVETTRWVVSKEKRGNNANNNGNLREKKEGRQEVARHASSETAHRAVFTKTNKTLYPDSLGAIIGQFKSNATKRIRKSGYPKFSWQPRFYDHIIRNEKDLFRIRRYIQNNPFKWELGKYYSE